MIDTAAKRASCLGIALLCLRTGVLPDGSNLSTAAERQHVVGLYVGLGAAPPAVTTPGPYRVKEQDVFTLGGVATGVYIPEMVMQWDA